MGRQGLVGATVLGAKTACPLAVATILEPCATR
jgi:hypothetical protein